MWEKEPKIFKQSDFLSRFDQDEVFEALKYALTNEDYIFSDKVSFFSDKYYYLNKDHKQQIKNDFKIILNMKNKKELLEYFKKLLRLDTLGIFVAGFFPFIRNSITRIGNILEEMFPNEVQIPGSNLDFDLFLGDYSKNVHGFHRDGANISFVYTKKTFNFWKFEVLEAEADKHALSHKKRAAFASGSFFFPKEMRKTLHEKYNDQKQSINLKDGDLLYWPTSSWHTADNLKQDVTFILNITLYKSNLLSINHSILSSLEQQELESKFELGSGFIPIEVADNETQRELFIEDEANKVLASLSQIKRIYSESREIFYSRFLSSFGIQNKFLKLMPINQCINIKNITLKKPLVFKIVTKLDKNLILNLYYFGSSVKIPNCSGAIEIINFINSSKSFCYQDLIDLYPDRKDLSKISYKIIAFLTKTPGVEI